MTPGWFERLLRSGELAKLAKQYPTQAALCKALGVTSDAYTSSRIRLIAKIGHVPTFDDLRKLGTVDNADKSPDLDNSIDVDFGEEEPTLRGVPVMGMDRTQSGHDHPDAAATTDVPTGHRVHGTSTLIDASGNTVMQWIKTSTSREQYQEALLEALSDPLTWLRGQAEPLPQPEYADEDLLTVYGIGDAHLGMQAHWEECGDNFDLKIAQRDLHAAVDALVALAPPSKHAIVLSVGDLLHFDNESKTTTAGTRQDADTRWSKVMRAAISTGRHCTDRSLTKHQIVEDIWLSGNHDTHSSTAVSLALDAFYENEPRVTVRTSPNPYQFYRFGKVLLGFCHGHLAKHERLPSIMACDRAADWGQTEFREWITGHVHHLQTKEYPGCVVKTLRTMATKDAWHHAAGYRSGSEMVAFTYHREFGLIDTKTIGLAQVRARAA